MPLPVERACPVGKITEEKLANLQTETIGELRGLELATLEHEFGRYGVRLYELARGIDESEVVPDQPTQSISVEGTLEKDLLLNELRPMIRRLAEKLWSVSRKEARVARTVALKLKTSEFKILTRSHTPTSPPSSCEELTAMALKITRARRPRFETALSSRWCRAEQLSRTGRYHAAASSFRIKDYLSNPNGESVSI